MARRVGLITCAAMPALHPDERPFVEALPAYGLTAVPLVWGEAALDADVDAYVVRNPWDWYLRADEFARFLARLPEDRCFNAPSLMRRCLGKEYLIDLERAGVPIVPTELVEGDSSAISAAIARRGWAEAVVKPVLSANAYRTVRVRDAAVEELPSGAWLAQRYMRGVEDGELSFVFFDGALSHVVRKRAKAGDFRVQVEHGGENVLEPNHPMLAALVAQASRALAALGEPPLYGRVDGVVEGGGLHVMELEVVEPQLFFGLWPQAGARLAASLARRLGALLVVLMMLAGCSKPAAVPGPARSAPDAGALLDGMGKTMLDPTRVDIMKPDVLVARLGLAPAAIVADIGAGPGAFTHALAAAVPRGRVIATDVKNAYLEHLAAEAARRGERNVEVRLVGPADSGLSAGEVDAVFMCQVDHYLADRRAWFSALRPALRSGGRLFVVNYLRERDVIDSLMPTIGWREVDRWEPVAGFFARAYAVAPL